MELLHNPIIITFNETYSERLTDDPKLSPGFVSRSFFTIFFSTKNFGDLKKSAFVKLFRLQVLGHVVFFCFRWKDVKKFLQSSTFTFLKFFLWSGSTDTDFATNRTKLNESESDFHIGVYDQRLYVRACVHVCV